MDVIMEIVKANKGVAGTIGAIILGAIGLTILGRNMKRAPVWAEATTAFVDAQNQDIEVVMDIIPDEKSDE